MSAERDQLARDLASGLQNADRTQDSTLEVSHPDTAGIHGWFDLRDVATYLIEAGYRKVTTNEDVEAEYWTAGRDSHGNIRLNRGHGRLVAHAAATRDQVQGWLDHAANGLHRNRYRAALELFDREAAGGQR